MHDDTPTRSPALEHVYATIGDSIARSKGALFKMRRGARMFPRAAVIPALVTIGLIVGKAPYFPVLLGLTATSVLLVGGLMYFVGVRSIEKGIMRAVAGLQDLHPSERKELLRTWLA
jgi:hypothetical protein